MDPIQQRLQELGFKVKLKTVATRSQRMNGFRGVAQDANQSLEVRAAALMTVERMLQQDAIASEKAAAEAAEAAEAAAKAEAEAELAAAGG